MEEQKQAVVTDREAVVRTYADMVYRLAFAQVRSRSDADDIFQEVFFRYFRKALPFDSGAHQKAWLLRVTINCAKKHRSSAWNRKTVPLDDSLSVPPHESYGLEEVLRRLPPKYRAVIHLFYSFMPVRRSCEDNGIRLEVVATYIHGNTAEIYITMQDLVGDRVDATTDLLDSYDIHRPFNSAAHCERVGYDPETKTATFLITITEWENHRIEGDKMTFSVRCFASRKQIYENVPVDIDLTAVERNAAVKDVYMPARVDYDDFVFDIPQSEIANYSLYGSFYTSSLYTEGNWRVTFPLEASWSQSPSEAVH